MHEHGQHQVDQHIPISQLTPLQSIVILFEELYDLLIAIGNSRVAPMKNREWIDSLLVHDSRLSKLFGEYLDIFDHVLADSFHAIVDISNEIQASLRYEIRGLLEVWADNLVRRVESLEFSSHVQELS